MAVRQLLVITAFALVGSSIHLFLYHMEGTARAVDRLDNVHARGHVQV